MQYRERDFLVRELYVTTISCVCAAILFGLFGAGLALHNTAGNPKEAICHYPGKWILIQISLDIGNSLRELPSKRHFCFHL